MLLCFTVYFSVLVRCVMPISGNWLSEFPFSEDGRLSDANRDAIIRQILLVIYTQWELIFNIHCYLLSRRVHRVT